MSKHTPIQNIGQNINQSGLSLHLQCMLSTPALVMKSALTQIKCCIFTIAQVLLPSWVFMDCVLTHYSQCNTLPFGTFPPLALSRLWRIHPPACSFSLSHERARAFSHMHHHHPPEIPQRHCWHEDHPALKIAIKFILT